MVSGSTVAHAAVPVPAWAAECAERDDDAARLACYDSQNPPRKKAARAQTQGPASQANSAPQANPAPQANSASRASSPRPSGPDASAAQAATPQATPPDDFGLSESRKRESAPPKPTESPELVAHVTAVSQRLGGELLLKLDNGQSWAQVQRNSAVHIKPGERVSIARGAFGGYLLRSDSGASLRVRRLE